ncbi:MAG: PA0069 family radical SAM protein [Pirellulales bacterium]
MSKRPSTSKHEVRELPVLRNESGDAIRAVGRGALLSPANRFERIRLENSFDQVEYDEDFLDAKQRPLTEYFDDDSQTIVSSNESPDVPFRYSMNPYRGCAHGCAYCYARPTHEYLGMSAGLDFESKILVKRRAPELLREFLSQSNWRGESIMMSGVTDCYQPAERHFQITRRCLEIASEAGQPMGIITKNALITRDLDILASMAARKLVHVAISITSLDQELTRRLEPRTSCPNARIRAVKQLSDAGVPVMVMAAPLIPGLTDSEIPAILEAAADAGACRAGYTLMRLPLSVRPIFLDWLEQTFPDKRSRIESCVRLVRSGELNDAEFKTRLSGTGVLADQIRQLFRIMVKRHGLDGELTPLDSTQFRPLAEPGGQMHLF